MSNSDPRAELEQALAREWPRLMRLCGQLSGDWGSAEDLAQETMVEAWRNAHKLHDPSGAGAWLAAIARNVCLRWARRAGRERGRFVVATPENTHALVEALPDEGADLEVELDRADLALLLDRALALLPPETSAVLIEHYLEQAPLGELAERLGLSAGAVAVRLHRGRLALRRVLTDRFPEEAAGYGLVTADGEGWQETRIWCPDCGQHRLHGLLVSAEDEITLRCPGCDTLPHINFTHTRIPGMFDGVKGYKAALNRVMVWADGYYRQALAAGGATCRHCGRAVQVCLTVPPEAQAAGWPVYGIDLTCDQCRLVNYQTLRGSLLGLPAGRAFWRRHQRIRTLPEQTGELHGREVIATVFEQVQGAARLEFIVDRASYEVLEVRGGDDE